MRPSIVSMLCAVGVLGGLFPVRGSYGKGDFQQVRIIATADLCCRIAPSADFDAAGLPRRELGGWPHLSRLIAELRTDATLVLDCGGFAFGSPEGQATQGRAAVRLMNLCRCDAAALGARDFCGGAENVEVMAKMAGFPILADPMLDVVINRRVPLFRPFLVKEVRGTRVALIAVSDPDVQRLNRKPDTRGFAPDEPVVQVRRYLAAVRPERADIIVAFGHMEPIAAAALLDTFPELSLVICPGTGREQVARDRLMLVGQYGQKVAVADLVFNRSDRKVYQVETRTMNVIPGRGDSAVAALAEEVRQVGFDAAGAFLGSELVPTDSASRLGSLVADAVRRQTRADVALVPWTSLGTGLTEGRQTKRTLFGVVPYCEPVRTVVMDETTLARLSQGLNPQDKFPALAGADLFVTGDTAVWPLVGQVARIRLRERKTQYRVSTTEQMLEAAGAQDLGRLSDKNLTDLWLDWAWAQDTLRPVSGPRLYPASARLVARPDSVSFPININTASAGLLEKLPGVGPMTARRIMEYRERHGRFSSVEDLLNVSGIGPKKLERIRPLATVR